MRVLALLLFTQMAALTAFAAENPRSATANQVREEISTDEFRAQRLVLAEAAYGVVRNSNTGLMYAAINLPSARDARRVQSILQEASRKGDADEFINRTQALALIKGGTALLGGGSASAYPSRMLAFTPTPGSSGFYGYAIVFGNHRRNDAASTMS